MVNIAEYIVQKTNVGIKIKKILMTIQVLINLLWQDGDQNGRMCLFMEINYKCNKCDRVQGAVMKVLSNYIAITQLLQGIACKTATSREP